MGLCPNWGLVIAVKEGFIYQTCQRRKVKSLCWHEGGSKPRVSSLLFTTYFSMGSLSHSGGSALVLTVVAITPHAFYLLLRDLFCSQTSSISQWPQGNNIRSNCCKVYPMNSIKCSSWYCLPHFLFGLFSAILPIWFIPCFSFQLVFGRRVNLVFSLFSSHLFFFLYYFSLSTYLISMFTVSSSHVSFELFFMCIAFSLPIW